MSGSRDLAAEVAALDTMPSAGLKAMWERLVGAPVPRVSPALLRLALAWELQTRALGGLPREVTRTLDQLAAGATRTTPARAGARLVREWQGRVHVVTVEDGAGSSDSGGPVRWEGRGYRSLSEVARAITGTRWSGPAFFGLKQTVAKGGTDKIASRSKAA